MYRNRYYVELTTGLPQIKNTTDAFAQSLECVLDLIAPARRRLPLVLRQTFGVVVGINKAGCVFVTMYLLSRTLTYLDYLLWGECVCVCVFSSIWWVCVWERNRRNNKKFAMLSQNDYTQSYKLRLHILTHIYNANQCVGSVCVRFLLQTLRALNSLIKCVFLCVFRSTKYSAFNCVRVCVPLSLLRLKDAVRKKYRHNPKIYINYQ